MKLYQLSACPFAYRARISLGEKSLPFETVLFEPGRRPAELDAIGPEARSPTLFDGDLVLWESMVICEYLEDRYPKRPLLPADPGRRAHARTAIKEIEKTIVSRNGALMGELYFKPADKRDPDATAKARADWHEALADYDRRLAGRRFLLDDELSLADVVLFTPIPTLGHLTGEKVPAGLSHLSAWLDRMAARPAMRPAWT